MGIGFVAKGNNIYAGSNVATEVLENGLFVDVTVADGTVAKCGAEPEVPAQFVVNVIDLQDEEGIATKDMEIAVGELVRHKRILPGEVVVTSEYVGDPAVGAKVAPKEGKLTEAASGAQLFAVVDKYTVGGVAVIAAEALN